MTKEELVKTLALCGITLDEKEDIFHVGNRALFVNNKDRSGISLLKSLCLLEAADRGTQRLTDLNLSKFKIKYEDSKDGMYPEAEFRGISKESQTHSGKLFSMNPDGFFYSLDGFSWDRCTITDPRWEDL